MQNVKKTDYPLHMQSALNTRTADTPQNTTPNDPLSNVIDNFKAMGIDPSVLQELQDSVATLQEKGMPDGSIAQQIDALFMAGKAEGLSNYESLARVEAALDDMADNYDAPQQNEPGVAPGETALVAAPGDEKKEQAPKKEEKSKESKPAAPAKDQNPPAQQGTAPAQPAPAPQPQQAPAPQPQQANPPANAGSLDKALEALKSKGVDKEDIEGVEEKAQEAVKKGASADEIAAKIESLLAEAGEGEDKIDKAVDKIEDAIDEIADKAEKNSKGAPGGEPSKNPQGAGGPQPKQPAPQQAPKPEEQSSPVAT